MSGVVHRLDWEPPDPSTPGSGSTGVETEALARALNPIAAVRLLSALGLSDGDIAVAVDATDRSVRRWRHEDERSAPTRHRKQIDDLRATVLILRDSGTLDDQGIVDWLRARNRELRDRRPLECLAEGEFEGVREAALAFVGD